MPIIGVSQIALITMLITQLCGGDRFIDIDWLISGQYWERSQLLFWQLRPQLPLAFKIEGLGCVDCCEGDEVGW